MPEFEVPYAWLTESLETGGVAFLVASLALLVWALLSKSKAPRRRRLIASLSCFLLFLTAFASGISLVSFVQLPTIRRNMANFEPPYAWSNVVLVLAAAGLMMASATLLVWAFIRSSGRRSRILLVSLCCFLSCLTASGVNYALIQHIQMPSVMRHQLYTPGALIRVGDRAPDVLITTLNGMPLRLSEHHGKVVLVNFFATWCGPCTIELPHLQEMWDDLHGNADFTMLIVGREESQEAVSKFKVANNFTFPMAVDLDGSAYAEFAEERIPRTYLVSRDGTVLFHSAGFSDSLFYETEFKRLRQIIASELEW
jgi:peroxiredoxin